jgi:hypothetical protein
MNKKIAQLKRVENRFIEAMSNAARARKVEETLLKMHITT